MIKAVIFDMDGVIVNSEKIHQNIEIELMKSYGHNISREELVRFTGTSESNLWSALKLKYNLELSVNELCRKKQSMYVKKLKNNILIFPWVKDILKEIKKRKMLIALASSSPYESINIIVDELDIRKYFNVIISGADLKESKPHPDIFLITAEKLNINTKDCIVIEDSVNGVKAAKSAGMKCIAITNTFKKEELSEADIIIESLEHVGELL